MSKHSNIWHREVKSLSSRSGATDLQVYFYSFLEHLTCLWYVDTCELMYAGVLCPLNCDHRAESWGQVSTTDDTDSSARLWLRHCRRLGSARPETILIIMLWSPSLHPGHNTCVSTEARSPTWSNIFHFDDKNIFAFEGILSWKEEWNVSRSYLLVCDKLFELLVFKDESRNRSAAAASKVSASFKVNICSREPSFH